MRNGLIVVLLCILFVIPMVFAENLETNQTSSTKDVYQAPDESKRSVRNGGELDEGPYLVMSSTTLTNSVEYALNQNDIDYDIVNSTEWANQGMEDYGTVLIGMDGGSPRDADVDALADFIEDGGFCFFYGGTALLAWRNAMQQIITTSETYNWARLTDTPHFSLVDDGHWLATDLPDEHNYTNLSASYYCTRLEDDDAEVVAVNSDEWPTTYFKQVGAGAFMHHTSSASSGYWSNEADQEFLTQIMANMLSFEFGEPDAAMDGYVYDSVTGDGLEGAIVRTGAVRDTTDDEGYYSMQDVRSGDDKRVTVLKEHYYDLTETIDIAVGDNEFDFDITPLATLTGVVTDSETDEVIEGAIITWGMHIDTTDVDGIYNLVDMEAAIDTLVIEMESYFDYEDLEYEVVDGDNEEDFAIDILSGDLTGVVIDELTEEQLFGVSVTVVNSETGDIYREVTTDEAGAYTAPALHDGVTYEVSVTLDGYAPSDVEDVLIRWNRDNEQDFELTPIFELGIRQLQQEQDLETWVTTTGIVTQGTNVTDTEHTSMYIQDDSGWGIMIWSDDPWDPENNINRGDGVTVIGFLVEVDDMNQIINFAIEVNSNDNAL
ncbi:MAG: carboxypeptidase regulatory-like domain-containing protein, partial [Candidatus Electryonea clarkiae]|nr:carboxypeptidase regulatory-like domain-containing protein [Candidatus Electryonea clarkiae]